MQIILSFGRCSGEARMTPEGKFEALVYSPKAKSKLFVLKFTSGKAQASDSFPLQFISKTYNVTSTASKISFFFLLPAPAQPLSLLPRPWDVLSPDTRHSVSPLCPLWRPDSQTDSETQLQVCVSLQNPPLGLY